MTPENVLITAAQDFALERDEEAVVDAFARLKIAALNYARPIVAEECARIVEEYLEPKPYGLAEAIREHGRTK